MIDAKYPSTGWIWTGEKETGDHKIFLFRHSLNLEVVPTSVEVKISADSRYRMYVNGVSVSFGPCKGDGQVWYYETVDIAPFLREGENILAAVVLRLSPLRQGNHSIWRTSYPGFYLNGDICATGEWKWRENTNIRFVPEDKHMVFLDFYENASGDASLHGWMNPGYDVSGWQNAVPYTIFQLPRGSSPSNLYPRPIPQMFERLTTFSKVEKLRKSSNDITAWDAMLSGSAIVLMANEEHIVELDAGEHTTGFLTLQCIGGGKARIEIMTAESYVYPQEKEGLYTQPIKGDRTDSEKGTLRGFVDNYTVRGYGCDESPEIYEPFWFRTFRFVRLSIKTGEQPLTVKGFTYRETGYPLEPKTVAETSDESLSAVWDISLRTLRRCMHETYEDCPFYEQLSYAMDTRTQILYTYAIAADDRMARRSIDDFHRSLRYDGLTNCCWPTVSPNVIPGFSLFYIMMIHDHMMYFGDESLVSRYLPTVDIILDFFRRNSDERGLVGRIGGVLIANPRWSFIDWTTRWSRTAGVPDAVLQGPITMESLLYAYTLNIAAELATFIGKTDRALEYNKRAAAIKSAVNKHCCDDDGLYLDGPGVFKYSQHCQVWAVLTETAPKDKWAVILEKALNADDWPKCSVAMAFYMFRALQMAGMYERSEALWNPWREMVKNNLTTCQENDTDARSDCHAWGSLALYELPSVILGVRPAKPGYAAVSVNPVVGYLQWAKGSVWTPHGEISVAWKRDGDDINVDIKVPDGVHVVSPYLRT